MVVRSLVRLFPILLIASAVNAMLLWQGLAPALPERAPAPAEDAETIGRLVVLGFDGVDYNLLRRYIDAGELPHLTALAEEGAGVPLLSSMPPESPVAWGDIMTGVRSGAHGIFDFIYRTPDYQPVNGMVEIQRARLLASKVFVRPPRVRSRLRARTFSERVRRAGYSVLALKQPLLFPVPRAPGARMSSGLATPDAAGTVGYSTVYSSAISFVAGHATFGTTQIRLTPGAVEGQFHTSLLGPFDPSLPRDARGAMQRVRLPMRLEVVDEGLRGGLQIAIDGQLPVLVAEGERSPVLDVAFPLGTIPSRTIRGTVRLEVKRVHPHVVVLADPINIDPRDAILPVATEGFGRELWDRYGPYETLGWQEQTFALNDRHQDDASFLRDLMTDMDRSAAMLLGELDRGDRLVFSVITGTDRACHAFWRYLDDGHPIADTRDPELADPILRVFRKMDDIVGEVRARLDARDTLLVVSDHGFQTWRYGVHLNQWLLDEGYLVLTGEAEHKTLDHVFTGMQNADPVDWSRTRAYALGLGQIYVNRMGRESQGIVADRDVPALVQEIRRKLLALENPLLTEPDDTVGRRAVRSVAVLSEIYSGPFAHEAAELQVGFDRGYRVSWQTALLGGMRPGGAVFEVNDVPWSGDHCSTDRELVPGILFSSRPMPTQGQRRYEAVDIGATVLEHFGLDTRGLAGQALPLRTGSPTPR